MSRKARPIDVFGPARPARPVPFNPRQQASIGPIPTEHVGTIPAYQADRLTACDHAYPDGIDPAPVRPGLAARKRLAARDPFPSGDGISLYNGMPLGAKTG